MNKSRIAYFVDDIATSFVIKDLRMISEHYQKIYLFSVEEIEEKYLIPENVELIDNFMDWKSYSKSRIILNHFFSIFSLFIKECFASGKILPFKKSLALIVSNIFKANEVRRHLRSRNLKPEDISLYYSFWFYDCVYLAWLKKSSKGLRIISRTHGGDLYEDRVSIRDKVLFRHFQMKYLDHVFPVSDMGTNYLREKYPLFKNKFTTAFLGTDDYSQMNPFDRNNFVLVSCASLRHHKRIHRIAEALLEVSTTLTWYHFGDENLHTKDPKIPEYLQRKKELESHPNIRFLPMGFYDNERLMDFYRTNQVSLFISLSAAEGIPVSIMEAISFGIPVLSTDVGGCAEIVTDKTGKLIPLSTGMKEVADILDGFMDSKMNTEEYRIGVRKYWQSKFDAAKNYKSFFDTLDKKIIGS